MSVLKAHRSESKAEFVNVANKIYIQTIAFLSRLSSRYSRLVSKSVSELASEVVDHAEKANSIYPSDAARKELRRRNTSRDENPKLPFDILTRTPPESPCVHGERCILPRFMCHKLSRLDDALQDICTEGE